MVRGPITSNHHPIYIHSTINGICRSLPPAENFWAKPSATNEPPIRVLNFFLVSLQQVQQKVNKNAEIQEHSLTQESFTVPCYYAFYLISNKNTTTILTMLYLFIMYLIHCNYFYYISSLNDFKTSIHIR